MAALPAHSPSIRLNTSAITFPNCSGLAERIRSAIDSAACRAPSGAS